MFSALLQDDISSVNSFLIRLAEEDKYVESHFSISLSLAPLSKITWTLRALFCTLENVGCHIMLHAVLNAVQQLGGADNHLLWWFYYYLK